MIVVKDNIKASNLGVAEAEVEGVAVLAVVALAAVEINCI